MKIVDLEPLVFNRSISGIDWYHPKISGDQYRCYTLSFALTELGFKSTESMHNNLRIWKREKDSREVLVPTITESKPSDSKDKEEPAKGKKWTAVIWIGITTFLVFALLLLAEMGLLGAVGDGLISLGRKLMHLQEADAPSCVIVAGMFLGVVLIVIGWLCKVLDKAYTGYKVLSFLGSSFIDRLCTLPYLPPAVYMPGYREPEEHRKADELSAERILDDVSKMKEILQKQCHL